MSRLHKALETLSPRHFSDVPDDISQFLQDTFAEAELIVNSVPQPPGGTDFKSASLTINSANEASNAAEIVQSTVRATPPHPDHEQLQKSWGKPIRLNAKDNPQGITMWKMAANDRHGAWFARRSVHEGLGFSRWKQALEQEFPQSLLIKGGPGSGNIRGLAADRRLEKKVVEGIGKMEVYELSAKFPPPTTPREFITLLLSTDSGLSVASASASNSSETALVIPRHLMLVSIPIEHDDTSLKDDRVRGKYESIEIIREIPLIPPKTSSTSSTSTGSKPLETLESEATTKDDSSSSNSAELSGKTKDNEDPEVNPVEWIMITRSDPGGTIPRFMVERSLPTNIATDLPKFLNWAIARDELSKEEESLNDLDVSSSSSEMPSQENLLAPLVKAPTPSRTLSDGSTFEPSKPGESGIIAALTTVVKDGFETYAPDMLQKNLSGFSIQSNPQATNQKDGEDDEDSMTDTSSLASFASAEQYTTAEQYPSAKDSDDSSEIPDEIKTSNQIGNTFLSPQVAQLRSSASSLTSSLLSEQVGKQQDEDQRRRQQQEEQYNREIARLEQRRHDLDEQFSRQREQQETRTAAQVAKDDKDEERARRRLDRERKKREEKHAKELHRLDRRQVEREKKAERRRRKAEEKDTISRLTRERDEAKRRAEILRKENEVWQERVGELQKENTMLVAKLGRLGLLERSKTMS